jgi:hypothetical protein
MAETTFLQIPIIAKFILPFLLVFFVIFAILEKIKLFGDGKKQLNALISFVIGLIFVGAVYPKLVVENLILYFVVAIVAIFIVLLVWGFIFGETKNVLENKGIKLILIIISGIIIVAGIVWATGWYKVLGGFFTSGSGLNQTFLINAIFIVVIAVALALILKAEKK